MADGTLHATPVSLGWTLTPSPVSSCPTCAQYAFNLFSHTTKIGENGYNEEEMKMVYETRKIWNVSRSWPNFAPRSCKNCPIAHAARAAGLGRRQTMTNNHHRPVLIRLRPLRTTLHAPL